MNNQNNNIDKNPKNDFEKEVIKIIKKNNYKLTADKIIQTLNNIRNDKKVSSRRWVWELMQNATDVRYENEKISVEIILNEDKLEFKHNGQYFKINNILAIAQQVSSKNSLNLEGQTGKFGTGFIGTHLLSDIIDIKGILLVNENDFREFQIRLDRSEKSSEQLAKNIEKSIEIFFDINKKPDIFKVKPNYLQNRKKDSFDTCFTYYLNDEEKKKAAIEGLNDLINTMPTTLITQYKKIEKVTIIDNIQQIETEYIPNIIGDEVKNGITESYVQTKTKNKNKEETIGEQYFLSYLKVNEETNKQTLRLITQIEKQNGIIVLLKRDINKPVLYRNFPLIGSNDFNMPFIVDGFDFNPLEARNGLFLNDGDKNNTDSNDNMKILDEAYQTSLAFIKCILTKYKNLMNRFILASSKMPKPIVKFDDYANDWFYQKQKEYRQGLREITLLKFGNYHKFDKLILPIFKENYNIEFFNVVSNLNIRKKILPQQEDYKNWYDIIITENIETPNIKVKENEFIKSWGYTMNKENNTKEINYIYDEIDFLKDLSNCKNIKTLSNILGKEKSEIINDLNEFLQFLKNIWKEEDILNTYAILPNRNGDFKKIKELYSDSKNIIPKPIMDIYDSISEKKLNEELIDSGINVQYLSSLNQKNFNDISYYLNEYIKKNENIKNIENIERAKKLVVYPLLSIKTNKEEIIKIYKFLTLFIKLDQKEIGNDNQTHIPTDLWTHAINFWYEEHPKEIEKYKNIKGFQDNLINKNITQVDVLKLINDYLDFLKSKNSEFKIFPNQNGDFCYLKDLLSDSGFPEDFKDILKKCFNIDKRNILLAKEIIALDNHKSMPESSITKEIESNFENLKKSKIDNNNKLKDIAFEILCLYPENEEKEEIRNLIEKIISPRKPGITYDNSLKNLGFAEIVFNKKDKYNIKYIKTNDLDYRIFINYILEIICDEIGNAGSFENIKNKFYGISALDDLEEFLSNIIKFIYDTKNTELFSKKIFLNKANNLVPKKEITIKKNFQIDEEDEKILINICLNKHINKDYRNSLINDKLYQNLKEYNIDFSELTLESICREIDNKIIAYDNNNSNQGKVYDKDIYNITKSLEKLKIDKNRMKELFLFYWSHKTKFSLNFFKDDDISNILSNLDPENTELQSKLLYAFKNSTDLEKFAKYLDKYNGKMSQMFSALNNGYSSGSGSGSSYLSGSKENNLNLKQEFRFKKKILDENKNEKIIYSKPLIIEQDNIKYYGSYYNYINKLEFELEELFDPLTSKKEMKIKYLKL